MDEFILYDDNTSKTSNNDCDLSSHSLASIKSDNNGHGVDNEQNFVLVQSSNFLVQAYIQDQHSIISLIKIVEDMDCPDEALPKIL